MARTVALLIMSFCFASMAGAETIVLDSGQTVEGQIIARNAMNVLVNVHGTPETFYWGEVESIDGQSVDLHLPQPAQTPAAQEGTGTVQDKKAVAPHHGDAEKRKHHPASPIAKASVPAKAAVPAAPAIPPAALQALHPESPTPNVIPTTDGGIIVVTHDKITKYDKDLRVIKEVDLNNHTSQGLK
ncbi:MAG: hypothetical protein KGJ09_05035 [Candidatus Omnitrophica bacterium]|nr:hypothetical protein [Candidatus Omnitrophota bacterium]